MCFVPNPFHLFHQHRLQHIILNSDAAPTAYHGSNAQDLGWYRPAIVAYPKRREPHSIDCASFMRIQLWRAKVHSCAAHKYVFEKQTNELGSATVQHRADAYNFENICPYLASDLLLEVGTQRHGQSLRHERGGEDIGRMGAARAAREALEPAEARHQRLRQVRTSRRTWGALLIRWALPSNCRLY